MDYDAFYVPNFITVSLPNIISSDNFAVLTPCAYEQDEEEEYLIRKVWPLFIETRKPGIGTYISTQILDSPQPQWKNLANRRWRSFQRNSSIYMTDTQFHLLMDSLQIWGMCWPKLDYIFLISIGGEITAKGTLLAQPLPSFIEK